MNFMFLECMMTKIRVANFPGQEMNLSQKYPCFTFKIEKRVQLLFQWICWVLTCDFLRAQDVFFLNHFYLLWHISWPLDNMFLTYFEDNKFIWVAYSDWRPGSICVCICICNCICNSIFQKSENIFGWPMLNGRLEATDTLRIVFVIVYVFVIVCVIVYM